MGASTAAYIVIKGSGEGDKVQKTGYKAFYGPMDKGSSKPSFCYPAQKEALKEEITSMEKAIKDGYVAETRIMKIKSDLRIKRDRLDKINAQEADAMKLFKENKDAIMKRREDLAVDIAQGMPSFKDIEKRRYNSHKIAENEKKKGLGKLKLEYQILSHLAEEESNTRFLQRDA